MKSIILFSIIFFGCNQEQPIKQQETITQPAKNIINSKGETVATRFLAPPGGYFHKKAANNSFAQYLRNLPLYPADKKVLLYDGSTKGNQNAHIAVVKMDVGKQDLQQCADAIMRLRAEYLYAQKKYNQLQFNFTNGFKAEYIKWISGLNISVRGNKVNWVKKASNNSSYTSFRNYLNKVFMYAGTASLEQELKSKPIEKIEAGDLFIKGGHPGHAVIVVDVCEHQNGDKAFLLAQSYMPAQEIHILKNPMHSDANPWYVVSEIKSIMNTPEWTFDKEQLRTFN